MARKIEKGGKFRNVQCRTWNMASKLKIMENEKNPLDDLKNTGITIPNVCLLVSFSFIFKLPPAAYF